MKPGIFLLSFLAAAAALAPLPLQGQDQPVDAEGDEAGHRIGYDQGAGLRMTVPVSIDGRGPYNFMVDTGSERTVIARELAEQLALAEGRKAELHSMTEVSEIRTAIIPTLQVGGRNIRNIHAPTLDERNIGAQGILGVDALQAQRVSFDFVRREMIVTPSRRKEVRWPRDMIVVTARRRFGHLILVDAAAEGQKIWVIVDTGAEVTVGNNALRRKLERKGRLPKTRPAALVSVTGGRMIADEAVVRRIRIGGIDIQDMPVAFADVHPFRKLDLIDRPAILLGMDVLRMFERVSVDFADKKVRLLPPRSAFPPRATRSDQ